MEDLETLTINTRTGKRSEDKAEYSRKYQLKYKKEV